MKDHIYRYHIRKKILRDHFYAEFEILSELGRNPSNSLFPNLFTTFIIDFCESIFIITSLVSWSHRGRVFYWVKVPRVERGALVQILYPNMPKTGVAIRRKVLPAEGVEKNISCFWICYQANHTWRFLNRFQSNFFFEIFGLWSWSTLVLFYLLFSCC